LHHHSTRFVRIPAVLGQWDGPPPPGGVSRAADNVNRRTRGRTIDIKTIGIDLGKTVCDAVAMDGRGQVLARRRLPRPQLVLWLANLPPCRIGMAASCGAHRLARRLAALGHAVKLMPAQ
jgi:hypothetical protein